MDTNRSQNNNWREQNRNVNNWNGQNGNSQGQRPNNNGWNNQSRIDRWHSNGQNNNNNNWNGRPYQGPRIKIFNKKKMVETTAIPKADQIDDKWDPTTIQKTKTEGVR